MQDLAQLSAMSAFALLAAWEAGSFLDTGAHGDDHSDAHDDQAAQTDDPSLDAVGDMLNDPSTVLDVPSYSGATTRLLDFDPQKDGLEIEYDAKTDPDTGEPIIPTVEIAYSANADATAVMLDGQPWVEMPGQVDLSADDVTLVPMEPAA